MDDIVSVLYLFIFALVLVFFLAVGGAYVIDRCLDQGIDLLADLAEIFRGLLER